MTETFKERDRLLSIHQDYKKFFDEFEPIARRKIIDKKLPYGGYHRPAYIKFFGDDLYDHPYMEYLEKLGIDDHGPSFKIAITLLINEKIINMGYYHNKFLVITNLWTIRDDSIRYTLLYNADEEEVRNNPFYPDNVIDWNDEHHLMFKMTYL